MKASDPRSRMFVGQGFTVRPSQELAIQSIEQLLKLYPQMIAMLEFTSKGRHRRQIDCALIGPGGVDLIEIKNKRGVVHGTPEGQWTVTSSYGTEAFFNMKNGVEENPFNQARNTADDLRDWIQSRVGRKVWVSPLVWLPSADPASQIEHDSFVRHVVGLSALPSRLRSSVKQENAWGRLNYLDLPRQFDLKPIDLSFLKGKVIEPLDHAGVAGVHVIARAGDESVETATDEHGQFSVMATKGSTVEVAFAVPGRYVTPDVLKSVAELDYVELPKVTLVARTPDKTEEAIREEARQQTIQETEARVAAQLRQSAASFRDVQAQMGMVIDDLQRQLRDALLRVTEQEQTLRQQRVAQKNTPNLPLPILVQQASHALELQQQRQQVTAALKGLSNARKDEQQEAAQHSLEVLSGMTAATRYQLTQAATPALTVKEVKVLAREPEPVPAFDAEPVDTAFQVIAEPPVETAQATPVPAEPVISTLPSQVGKPKWPWVMGALVVGLVALGALWQSQQSRSAARQLLVEPAVSGAEALPGVPSNHAGPNGLPGVPVPNRP